MASPVKLAEGSQSGFLCHLIKNDEGDQVWKSLNTLCSPFILKTLLALDLAGHVIRCVGVCMGACVWDMGRCVLGIESLFGYTKVAVGSNKVTPSAKTSYYYSFLVRLEHYKSQIQYNGYSLLDVKA